MAITAAIIDQTITNLTGIAASGGTATVDTAIATDTLVRLVAYVMLLQASASHLSKDAQLYCEYCVQNKNGTVTACTAIATSANPDNSGGVALTTKPETNELSAVCTANWTISSTNARLTITNNDTGAAVDACVFMTTYAAKNV